MHSFGCFKVYDLISLRLAEQDIHKLKELCSVAEGVNKALDLARWNLANNNKFTGISILQMVYLVGIMPISIMIIFNIR